MMVKELNPGFPATMPEHFTALGPYTYFTAWNGEVSNALFRTDGTGSGTSLIPDVSIGAITDYSLVPFKGDLYFASGNPETGDELWKFTSADATVSIVKDIVPGPDSSYPQVLTVSGGNLYFRPEHDTSELWRTDGTPDGTILLHDFGDSGSGAYTDVNGRLYFESSNDGHSQLWTSDGTPEGTIPVNLVNATLFADSQLIADDATLLLTASTASAPDDAEIFAISGPGGPAVALTDLASSGLSASSVIGAVGQRLFFWAKDQQSHTHFLVRDGGSGSVTNLFPDASAISILPGSPFNGAFLLAVTNLDNTIQTWHTDGTPEGTWRFDLTPGSVPSILGSSDTQLFFSTFDPAAAADQQWKLWAGDQTLSHVVQIPHNYPGPNPTNFRPFTFINGQVFFDATDSEHGDELWTINPQDYTTLSLKSSDRQSKVGQRITLAATLSGATDPTALVTFMDGQTMLGAVAPNAKGVAKLSISAFSKGIHQISASFAGDENSAPSAADPIRQLVGVVPIPVKLSVTASAPAPDEAATVTAILHASKKLTHGQVTFYDGDTAIGQAEIGANSKAVLNLRGFSGTLHPLTARYDGEGLFKAATSPVRNFDLRKTISIKLSTQLVQSTYQYGQGLAIGAEFLHAPSVLFDGVLVRFMDLTTGRRLGSSQSDQQILPVTPPVLTPPIAYLSPVLAPGTHRLVAQYAGDSQYQPSTSRPLTIRIIRSDTRIDLQIQGHAKAGNPITLAAEVRRATDDGATGKYAAGLLSFYDGDHLLGRIRLKSAKAVWNIRSLSRGHHAFRAEYAGDDNYNPSASPRVSP